MTRCPLPANEATFCLYPRPQRIQEYLARTRTRPAPVRPHRNHGEYVHDVLAAFEGGAVTIGVLCARTRYTSDQVRGAIRNLLGNGRIITTIRGRGGRSGTYEQAGGEV